MTARSVPVLLAAALGLAAIVLRAPSEPAPSTPTRAAANSAPPARAEGPSAAAPTVAAPRKPSLPAPTRASDRPDVPATLARLAEATRRVHEPGSDRKARATAQRQALSAAADVARADLGAVERIALAPGDGLLRLAAVAALAEAGGEEAARALSRVLALPGETSLTLALIHALVRAGGPVAREALSDHYLRSVGDRYRYHAVAALGRLKDPRSLPLLAQALREDPDPAVRAHAATALAETGGTAARDALDGAHADGHPAVEEAIRRARARLQPTPR